PALASLRCSSLDTRRTARRRLFRREPSRLRSLLRQTPELPHRWFRIWSVSPPNRAAHRRHEIRRYRTELSPASQRRWRDRHRRRWRLPSLVFFPPPSGTSGPNDNPPAPIGIAGLYRGQAYGEWKGYGCRSPDLYPPVPQWSRKDRHLCSRV